MNKNLNKNKGITLIALVITIIVMLILVSVSISMAVNGGLFNYAGKASKDTQNAIDKEKELAGGRIEVGGIVYNSIDDYLKSKPAAVHNWTQEADTITCAHCNKTYTVGQEVDYTAAGVASTTLSAEKSGAAQYKTDNKKGDYSWLSGANSTTGEQTITKQTDITWVVLGIENTDGDEEGINETLLITTSEPVYESGNENGIYVYGKAAYNNIASYKNEKGEKVEGELDRICRELYSNKAYGEARGMTIEDVNNVLGYVKTGGIYYDTEGNMQYTTGFTTKMENIPGFKDKVNGTEGVTGTGYNQTPDGTDIFEYYNDGYAYRINQEDNNKIIDEVDGTIYEMTENAKNIIFGENINYFYHLASRGSITDTKDGGAGFGSGFTYGGIANSYGHVFFFFYSDGASSAVAAPFRPVVSLIFSNLPDGK